MSLMDLYRDMLDELDLEYLEETDPEEDDDWTEEAWCRFLDESDLQYEAFMSMYDDAE